MKPWIVISFPKADVSWKEFSDLRNKVYLMEEALKTKLQNCWEAKKGVERAERRIDLLSKTIDAMENTCTCPGKEIP